MSFYFLPFLQILPKVYKALTHCWKINTTYRAEFGQLQKLLGTSCTFVTFFNIKYSIQNGLIQTKNKACLLLKYERILCFRQNELNWHRFKFAPSIFEELEKWLIWTKRCKISARRFQWCSTTMLFFKFDHLEEFYDR